MRRIRLARVGRISPAWAVLGLVTLAPAVAARGFANPDQAAGSSRTIRALDGQLVPLAAPRGGVLALVFTSTECPIANAYSPTLNALAADFPAERFRLVALCVDPDLDDDAIAKHAREYDLKFPVGRDRWLVEARRLGVTKTPEAVVIDDRGEVRYRGRIDDQFAARLKKNANSKAHDLRDAVEAVLAGLPVANAEVEVVGCPLPEPACGEAREAVTYARDVAPILQKNCQECHRKGQLGPFPLETYEQARKRADDLAGVAEQRLMPPWRAVPGVGPSFKHDRSLSTQEIDTLIAWAEARAPEGDAGQVPPSPSFPEGWALGTPDVVLSMPEPYEIAASGADTYRCFVIKNPLPEDAEIIGLEYRPGNVRVVHHILGYVDVSGQSKKNDEADPGQGYTCFGGPMIQIHGDLGGWAPGSNPDFLPDGVGRILPKGADIVLQVHYHPNGKPETDVSRLGLYLAPKDKPIRQAFHWTAAAEMNFEIPAGASDFEIKGASVPMPTDVQVLAVSPHMHQIGRMMEMWAVPPEGKTFADGTRRIDLIRIDDWDFNWQLQYYYEKPVDLPAGSVVLVRARYDNSDGAKPVKFGEATTDEMCFGFFGVAKKHQDLTRGDKDDLREMFERSYEEIRKEHGKEAPTPRTGG